MSSYQITSLIGIPLTVLLVFAILVIAARPDRDPDGDGLYAIYLATASITALYVGLIMAASLGQAITGYLVGKDPSQGGFSSSTNFVSLYDDGSSGSSIAAYGAVVVVAAIVYGFHARRRRELGESAHEPGAIADRIDGAYLAAVCFAMISIALAAGVVAGESAVTFLSPPNHGDYARDIAGGTALSYGLLILVAFLIFRSRFWAIRGGRPSDDEDLPLAELGEP